MTLSLIHHILCKGYLCHHFCLHIRWCLCFLVAQVFLKHSLLSLDPDVLGSLLTRRLNSSSRLNQDRLLKLQLQTFTLFVVILMMHATYFFNETSVMLSSIHNIISFCFSIFISFPMRKYCTQIIKRMFFDSYFMNGPIKLFSFKISWSYTCYLQNSITACLS